MRLSGWASALPAGTLLLFASLASAQTSVVSGYKPVTTLECFKSVDTLKENSSDNYMSDGMCQQRCGALQQSVMAITGGSTCFCGDTLPPDDQQVDKSKCNSPCNGFNTQFCGGIGYFQLYLTGAGGLVQAAPDPSDTSSSVSPTTVTQTAATVTIPPSSDAAQSKGPNKVGIAVGVVMGLVVVAGIIGVTVFLLKQRKRRAIEEEHKRNAAVNDFIGGKRSEASSVTDQRLDPSFLSSHRRESIGSIADEMDFSRRILQVRNPDHRASQASNLA